MHLLLCINYNCGDLIAKMISSIPEEYRKAIEVCIVDNSGELGNGHFEEYAHAFSFLSTIQVGKNAGYFGGAQIGLENAAEPLLSYDSVLIVNPDIIFE